MQKETAAISPLARRGPLNAAEDDRRHFGVCNRASVVAERAVDDAALAVGQPEDQRFGLLAPVGIGLHQHVDRLLAFQLGIKLVVGMEVFQPRGDRVFVDDDLASNSPRGPWPGLPITQCRPQSLANSGQLANDALARCWT